MINIKYLIKNTLPITDKIIPIIKKKNNGLYIRYALIIVSIDFLI